MICPTCGYQNSPREKFCQQCGLILPKASRSKLPVVILVSFLLFTAIGTGLAYHFGVSNNDPKYVKYDKIELKDVTGTWKLVDATNKEYFSKDIKVVFTPSELKIVTKDDTKTVKLTTRIISNSTKLIAFMKEDEGTNKGIEFRMEKRKINGIERNVLAMPVDNEWGYFVRERK